MLETENLGDPLKSYLWVYDLRKCEKKNGCETFKMPQLGKLKFVDKCTSRCMTFKEETTERCLTFLFFVLRVFFFRSSWQE